LCACCDLCLSGAGRRIVDALTTSCVNGGGTGRTILPEAVSARMRKRRCFADTELDAVMLERERAHALFARRAASVVPQQPVLFRLPFTPYQFPPSDLARGRPDETAMRLIGLIRSWWTPPSVVSEAGVPTASGCRQPLKSSVDVGGTFTRPQQPNVGGMPLPSTVCGTLAPTLVRTTTAGREDQRPSRAVVNQPQDHPSPWTNASASRRHLVLTRTHRDSDKEHESKSRRTTKTFDFSVESLLAK